MELTKQCFDPNSIEIMDQVALLIYISEQVLGLARTYHNNDDLTDAKPDVMRICKFSEAVSVKLIGAIFHTSKNKKLHLDAAYKLACSGIYDVIRSAEHLQRIELKDTNGQGKVIANAVLPNLRTLGNYWTSLPIK